MIYKTFPTVDKVFLDALRERYPDTCPRGSSPDDLYRKQGEQAVIDFLRHQYNQQNLNLLES